MFYTISLLRGWIFFCVSLLSLSFILDLCLFQHRLSESKLFCFFSSFYSRRSFKCTCANVSVIIVVYIFFYSCFFYFIPVLLTQIYYYVTKCMKGDYVMWLVSLFCDRFFFVLNRTTNEKNFFLLNTC